MQFRIATGGQGKDAPAHTNACSVAGRCACIFYSYAQRFRYDTISMVIVKHGNDTEFVWK